jgi:hypothetical protein
MGRRTKLRKAETADLGVTLLGVVGFLGFLAAARMNVANSSPFDAIALLWFATFGTIKICLPRLLAKREGGQHSRAGRRLTY